MLVSFISKEMFKMTYRIMSQSRLSQVLSCGNIMALGVSFIPETLEPRVLKAGSFLPVFAWGWCTEQKRELKLIGVFSYVPSC